MADSSALDSTASTAGVSVGTTSSTTGAAVDSGADIIETRDVSCQHIREKVIIFSKNEKTEKTNTKKRLVDRE